MGRGGKRGELEDIEEGVAMKVKKMKVLMKTRDKRMMKEMADTK